MRNPNNSERPGRSRRSVPIRSVSEPRSDANKSDAPGSETRVEIKPWALQHFDSAGVIGHSEGDLNSIFGRTSLELTGTSVFDLLHEDDRLLSLALWDDLLAESGGTRTIRQRAQHPDGRVLWIETIFINHLDLPEGYVMAVHLDITAEVDPGTAASATESRFRMLADEMPIGVFESDMSGSVLYGNARFVRDVTDVGTHILDVIVPADAATLVNAWMKLIEHEPADGLLVDVETHDGRTLHILAHVVRAADGTPSIVGSVEDITEALLSTRTLREEASRDPLTRLLHRSGLRRAWDALVSETFGVLFIDLDGFKQINDEFGHTTGDAVLVETALRLQHSVRPSDLVCRYGGDEFVVVLTDVRDMHQLQRLASRTQAAVEGPMTLPGDLTAMIRASTGYALAGPGENLPDVLQRADAAMYVTKRDRASKSTVGRSIRDAERPKRPLSRSR